MRLPPQVALILLGVFVPLQQFKSDQLFLGNYYFDLCHIMEAVFAVLAT